MWLIWFGYIARLSPRGGGGYFTCSNNFYLPSRRLEEKGGGGRDSALWARPTSLHHVTSPSCREATNINPSAYLTVYRTSAAWLDLPLAAQLLPAPGQPARRSLQAPSHDTNTTKKYCKGISQHCGSGSRPRFLMKILFIFRFAPELSKNNVLFKSRDTLCYSFCRLALISIVLKVIKYVQVPIPPYLSVLRIPLLNLMRFRFLLKWEPANTGLHRQFKATLCEPPRFHGEPLRLNGEPPRLHAEPPGLQGGPPGLQDEPLNGSFESLHSSRLFTFMRMRIRLLTLMWIRDPPLTMMQIHGALDP